MSNTYADKYRNFAMVLYPNEDTSHLFCMNTLHSRGYNYCSIVHENDVWSENDKLPEGVKVGDKKKSHTHVIVKFNSARYVEPLASELGIKSNYVEPVRNLKNALLYLVHDGYPEKFQYDVSEVTGPLRFELEKHLVSEDESARIIKIIDLIDSMPVPCSYRKLLLAVCNNGLYGDFRRMGVGVKSLLEEHNAPAAFYEF